MTTAFGAEIQSVQLETGLTVNANDEIFLSPSTAGAGTNVEPTTSGQVVKPIGVIADSSGYVGGSGLGAKMVFQPGPATLIA